MKKASASKWRKDAMFDTESLFLHPEISGCNFSGENFTPYYTPKKSGCTVNLNFSFAFFEGGGSKKRNRKITFYTLKKSGCKFKNRGVENFYTLFFEFTPCLHPEIFLKSGCKFSPLFVLKFLYYTPIFILHPEINNVYIQEINKGGSSKEKINIKNHNHAHTRAHA